MFLAELNNRQKELFYQLCYYAALANGTFEDHERTLLQSYAKEMSIEYTEERNYADLSEILKELLEISGAPTLRKITFEIIGMMFSDGNEDEQEKIFVNNMTKAFEIPADMADRLNELFNDYRNLYFRILQTVNQL